MNLRDMPSRLPRRPPLDATEDERIQHQQRVEDELARRTAMVAEHVPGSRHDEVTITSAGEGEEVRVENPFDWVPTRMEGVDVPYPYVMGRSRNSLASESFIWVKCSAPKGTKLIARFYPM